MDAGSEIKQLFLRYLDMRRIDFRHSTFILPFFLLATFLIGCNDLNNDFSTNPNYRLTFSVDTLSFDTVFTTIGSATREFMVYNPHPEPLNIQSIQLAGPSKSGFRINVDGRSGETFTDIRIEDKDSLYVLVEVTVDPTGNNEPLLIEDHLQFTTNGTTQSVLLRAFGQDVNLMKGGTTISEDTVWTAERPYLIYDSVVVAKGVTLEIEKGSAIHMHDKARWVIHGTIKAKGTPEEPVLFRGDRLDNLLSGLPYDRVPGQWDGIYFKPESYNNVMDHVIIRNGETALRFYESSTEESKLKINNSQVTNFSSNLLYAENCRIEAMNTEFTNAGGGVISLHGGEYHFIHCTFANYLKIQPGRNGSPVIRLYNYLYTLNGGEIIKKSQPLQKATFDNCLIDGSLSEGTEPLKGEMSIDNFENGELNYLFNHCAVKTMKTDNAGFTNVQFISKDRPVSYIMIGDNSNDYIYDYRPSLTVDKEGNPQPDQVVIGKADRKISELYPTDRLGINRFSNDEGPDIGAYEHLPERE